MLKHAGVGRALGYVRSRTAAVVTSNGLLDQDGMVGESVFYRYGRIA